MVENSLSVAGFCVCSAILAVLLRQYCREQSMLTALAACCAILSGCVIILRPMLTDIRSIFQQAGISDSYIALLFKSAAICYITQITCDICKDCGESAISSAFEMWGRASIAMLSLPVLRALLERISLML